MEQIKTQTFTSMERSEGEARTRLERKVVNFTTKRGVDFCRILVNVEPIKISEDGDWYLGSQRATYRETKFKPGSYFDRIINAQ